MNLLGSYVCSQLLVSTRKPGNRPLSGLPDFVDVVRVLYSRVEEGANVNMSNVNLVELVKGYPRVYNIGIENYTCSLLQMPFEIESVTYQRNYTY